MALTRVFQMGQAGLSLALSLGDMNSPLCLHQSSDGKAVWGPKRTFIASALHSGSPVLARRDVAAGSPSTQANRQSDQGRRPGRSHRARRSRTTSSTAKSTRRVRQRNPTERTRVIVTLQPGAKLPPEFKRYRARRREARHHQRRGARAARTASSSSSRPQPDVFQRALRPADWQSRTTAPPSPSAPRPSRELSATPAPASASRSSIRASPPGTTT